MENKSPVVRLVVMGEKTWTSLTARRNKERCRGCFKPIGIGTGTVRGMVVPTRIMMLVERETERAGWESSVANDIEGECGSQERSGPASSKAAFSARIRHPMETLEVGRSNRKET